jgi:Ni,Fe-hydrogenase III large subunit
MHPEVLQDEPGSCPKCGMFLVETTTKQQNKHSPALKMDHSTMDHSTMDHSTMDHSKMDHSKMDHSKMDHSKMDNSKTDNSKTDHSKMDHSKTDHSKMDHSKMDHSKMDHSKMDHSKMDHSKMDHSKMDHSKADHSKMDHSKMSFMSMVDVTKDLPRSEDGLQMEWFDLPFGPFFPGLPAGLFINFTLDGDAVADCKLNQEFSIKSLKAELPMHAGCFFQRLFALNPLIHNCLTVLIQQVIENANGQYPNDDTQKSRIVAIEHERIINHLSWFCQLGKQTGMHNLARKAEALQLLLYKADFEQIIQLDSSLNGFVKYLMKIPFLKLRTQNIGKLSKDGGVFGPLARSMNIDNDVRSEDEVYKQFHFKPILLDQGDAYARLKIRALEINQSIGLIKNAGLFNPLVIGKTDNLTGSGMAQVESPRGKMMLKISFDSGTIQSFEMKTPSSTHIQLIGSLVHLQEIGDALIAIGSLDLLPTEVFQ